MDVLYGEHFKLAHCIINVLLSLVFNCMIIHGYMPLEIINTLLIPLITDKGKLWTSDNYRPCFETTAISLDLKVNIPLIYVCIYIKTGCRLLL